MTRRYNLSHSAGQPMPEDWIHLPDSVVASADYDALTARLQKVMARCADLLDEDQFNELDAMTRATDPTSEVQK